MVKYLVVLISLSLALLAATGKSSFPKSLLAECTGTPAECEAEATQYIEVDYEAESSRLCQVAVAADFAYNTDLNNAEKEAAAAEANIAYFNFQYQEWNENIRFYKFHEFTDESLKRQFQFLNITGIPALDATDLARYNAILGEMSKIYGTAKICPYTKQNCDLEVDGIKLEPDIEEIIATSRDSEELRYTWQAWRNTAGKPIKEMYKEYVQLSNKAAKLNGLNDNSDLWLLRYESDEFKRQVTAVWDEVKELYQQLYSYVRYRLRQNYPNDIKAPDDPIPAHLLGNMWSQTWESIQDLVIPFPDSPAFDVTEKLREKYTGTQEEAAFQMFEEANRFFTGLGLSDMSMSYGPGSMITRPTDGREVVCHASAWDMCDKTDYRIKMCTNINQEDFITIHHELGHIQYFINYKDQPITFRDGANPGFHEAIGDVLSLSVATPKHMKKLGLVDSDVLDPDTTINFFMQKALDKICFLPFGYLIDAYRWKLFDGSITEDKIEYEWLKIRNEIQGIVPPVKRSEADFDAGAKYHVPGNTPYIRYFVSFIIQFQIHEALCIAAGQYDPNNPNTEPLYNCDIDGNYQAGTIMKTLLAKGFSENWQEVLLAATGSRDMKADAIKNYFEPLTAFLKQQELDHQYPTTWSPTAFEEYYESSTTTTTQSTSTDSSSSNPCLNSELEFEDELRSTNFNNFLTNSIENYGQWLINNGLDPSPPIFNSATLNISSSFLQLNGSFGNTIGSGMSNQVYVILNSVSSDFLTSEFKLGISLADVSIYGKFNASGSIISTYPLSGDGDWEIKFSRLNLHLSIFGFAIENGFINMDKFENRTISIDTEQRNSISIPDLITEDEADGFGGEVLEILLQVIPQMLQDQEKHPIIKSFLDYLKFQFLKTPLSEIIATTRPPCIL